MLDFIYNGKTFGSVGQRLVANGMNVNTLRPWIGEDGKMYVTANVGGKPIAVPIANATLRKDEWKQYDAAILEAAQQRLIGVADLMAKGLTFNISNGLGTTVMEYEDQSDVEDAQISMDGTTRGLNDRPEFDLNYLPLPITHADFQLNIRQLNASRTIGSPLDTTIAALKARKIAEMIENTLFNGASTYTYGGGTIYGYTDFPHRNTIALSENWDAAGKTGEEILDDVLAMKQASIDDRYYGPWMLYVPTAYETPLDDDFKANSDITVRERILKIEGIQGVKVVDKLTANNVVLVQMTSDVVRMVIGLPITNVEWQTEGGMIFRYKIMTIQVPQLRADQNDRTGIVHLS